MLPLSAGRPKSSPSHSRSEPRQQRRISPKSSRQHLSLVPQTHHSHSHSAPQDSPRSGHRRQQHNDPRRSNYGMSTSQQPLSSPHHTHNSPKRAPMPMYVGRRRSHDTNMDSRKLTEQRRRSADPALNFDPSIKRGQESGSDGDSGDGRMRAYHSQLSDSPRRRFEDSSSDHSGSQPLASDDIYMGVTEYGNGSSTSTLTAAVSPLQYSTEQQQKLSQVEFVEEEPTDLSIEYHPLITELQSEMSIQHLSQPSSPPKSRHGKSLTDIHAVTSTLSHSQQFLSQSVAEFPHYHHWDNSPYYTMADTSRQAWFHDGRFRRPVVKPALSTSHGQIYRMYSDPHLNYDPGSHSIKSRQLKKVAEEEEQKETRSRQTAQRSGPQRGRGVKGQQLGRKHLKATVVSETNVRSQPDKHKRYVRYPLMSSLHLSLLSLTPHTQHKVTASPHHCLHTCTPSHLY